SLALQYFADAERMQMEWTSKHPLLYSVRGYKYCDLLLSVSECDAWRTVNAQTECNSESVRMCTEVTQRAAQILEWDKGMDGAPTLDLALHNLTLCRATLYVSILARHKNPPFDSRIDYTLDELRTAGVIEYLVRGLLTRAWLRKSSNELAGIQTDLDEAWEI